MKKIYYYYYVVRHAVLSSIKPPCFTTWEETDSILPTNQQLTTLIDNKSIDKEDNNSSREEVRAKLENETLNNSLWLEQTSMALRSTDILKIGMDVLNEWGLAKISLDRYDAQHLFNHIRKKLEIAKQQQRPSKAEEKADRKAELKQIIMSNLMQMQYDNTTEHKN